MYGTFKKNKRKIHYDRYLPSHYGLLQGDCQKMSGSDFSDVLLEVGMITTCSMTGLMNGENK